MNPKEFVDSLYLGDRACKAILIDSWKRRVGIQVDSISRLRPGSATWDFYTGRDVQDGWLIFSEVTRITFDPPGPIPNDLMEFVSVTPVQASQKDAAAVRYHFELSIGSIDSAANSTAISVKIEATRLHLEDPAKPGVEIVD